MKRQNAKDVTWEKVDVLGKECLFVELRIDKDTVPEGYFMYEVRHSDEDWGEPCKIAPWIMVNFFGTLLTKEPFELESNELYLDWKEDWVYLDGLVEFR